MFIYIYIWEIRLQYISAIYWTVEKPCFYYSYDKTRNTESTGPQSVWIRYSLSLSI